MRQAGRYLPEYRALRAVGRRLSRTCATRRSWRSRSRCSRSGAIGFDAAILFSDILVVPDALGADVRFVEGEGPQLDAAAERGRPRAPGLPDFDAHLAPVYETLRRLAAALPPEVTLIGFAGAPWTLAAYMVEGGGSKEFLARAPVGPAAAGAVRAR